MSLKLYSMRTDWIGKTLAGLLLGFVIAIGISGVFMEIPMNISPSIKVQLAMWIVAPVWIAILSSCYLFQSGKKAWFYLLVPSIFSLSFLFLYK